MDPIKEKGVIMRYSNGCLGFTDYSGINMYLSLSIYLAILSSTMDEVFSSSGLCKS